MHYLHLQMKNGSAMLYKYKTENHCNESLYESKRIISTVIIYS